MKLNAKAIAASFVASQALGFLWYGVLFGQPWAAAQGKTLEGIHSTPTPFVLGFIATLLYAIAVGAILRRGNGELCPGRGAAIGAGIGLALVALPLVTHYAFLSLSPTLMLIDGSKELMTGIVVGAINGFFVARER
jgi:hypothetical protein